MRRHTLALSLGFVLSIATVAHSASVPQGATIAALTGSAGTISPNTSPYNYGKYSAWGDGYPLIGGPLLNDAQAASFVKVTQKSKVELGSNGTAGGNAAANNYFNSIASSSPGWYLTQLSSFHAAYVGKSWQAEASRIDGACPMAHPTTAEVIQWAGNKWGINPILLYAFVTNESSWDQTGIGDHGGSSGLFQVADRNTAYGPHHTFPGFSGAGSMLARENTCFNADYFSAWLYSSWRGIIGSPGGNIGTAIQSWATNYAYSPGYYTTNVYSMLTHRYWIPWDFYGQWVPY